jgi:hypothetical protein
MPVPVGEGVVEVTPSGLPIYYQDNGHEYRLGPKIGQLDPAEALQLLAAAPDSVARWPQVVSVTQVLDVLFKPLQWWGMVTGVEGVQTLLSLGIVREVVEAQRPALAVMGQQDLHPASTDALVELLSRNKLTVNHVRDRAGDRGIAVHDALVGWAESGRLPDPTIYGATEAGYVRGLVKFLRDVEPEPIAREVLVASAEHGYAGRYDLRMRVDRPRNVVARCGLKRGPVLKRLGVGEILADLKTSSGIYESHPRQLEAYEHASLECGWPETSARGIIRVTDEGLYEFVRSWATFEDFEAVLQVWRSNQSMRKRKKEAA